MYVRRKYAQADLNFIQQSHIFQTAMKKYASCWDMVALITRKGGDRINLAAKSIQMTGKLSSMSTDIYHEGIQCM
jgi:hypothetical protein